MVCFTGPALTPEQKEAKAAAPAPPEMAVYANPAPAAALHLHGSVHLTQDDMGRPVVPETWKRRDIKQHTLDGLYWGLL